MLWIPFPPDVDFPELHAALELGHGVPAYAENGLRALRMLAGYRTQYEVILSRLAHRIVGLAGDNPLKRSPAPDGLLRSWPRPDAGIEKHESYALQWYSLAGLAVVLFVVLSFKRVGTP